MKKPVPARFSATHSALSVVPEAKLMATINLPQLLSSSQDHVCRQGPGRASCPWAGTPASLGRGHSTAEHGSTCLGLRFPGVLGPDVSPASHTDGLHTDLPLFLLGKQIW